jgi:hypothetical protein
LQAFLQRPYPVGWIGQGFDQPHPGQLEIGNPPYQLTKDRARLLLASGLDESDRFPKPSSFICIFSRTIPAVFHVFLILYDFTKNVFSGCIYRYLDK